MNTKKGFGPRRGLHESLEQYAARHGVRPHEARNAWRVGGAVRLGLPLVLYPDGLQGRGVPAIAPDGPRIAPGVPCPTVEVGS